MILMQAPLLPSCILENGFTSSHKVPLHPAWLLIQQSSQEVVAAWVEINISTNIGAAWCGMVVSQNGAAWFKYLTWCSNLTFMKILCCMD